MVATEYAEGFCVTCDKTVPVHVDTRRCQRCGKSIGLQALTTGHANGASAPVQALKITLLSTARSRKWMETTLGLIEDFEREATALRSKIESDTKRVAELETTLSALRSVPRQVSIETAPVVVARQKRDGSRLGSSWSRTFAACTKCGTTERKHKAKGLCSTCYA